MPQLNKDFVLIDVVGKRYARYHGRTEREVYLSDMLLDQEEVEAMRTYQEPPTMDQVA